MLDRVVRIAFVVVVLLLNQNSMAETSKYEEYASARWDPIHFEPKISEATDKQCLQCHHSVFENSLLSESPAGLNAREATAWYQTLDTYQGEQDTFHRRHMVSGYANQVMDLKCNTCHQGNDPREEVAGSSVTTQADLTMRKQVDPYVCVLCHGQNDYKKMALPGPWTESAPTFGNNCLTCHAGIKTERHEGITFLKGNSIEELAAKNSDVCYGCHGGRAWYSIAFPYSEKSWPGHGKAPRGAGHKYPSPVVPVAGIANNNTTINK